ncbi:auxin response factor 16-like [Rosa rugosa]|uniref:auxin response factor 16-like n=1 Tax=Rosa rugosa TaxID=74645 RepID=UPI002B40EE13|nr:auxin response factor 16-like [Rosa rugosa]
MADPETDEVFARIWLLPSESSELFAQDRGYVDSDGSDNLEKPSSLAKTLTQSDANNGGSFSVPRYCVEIIFLRLDYSADPPVQTVVTKGVHGEVWKFQHIYLGIPRRHLLMTEWSMFVNQKKLVVGDSIVFLRVKNGDLCVWIWRAKRGSPDGWSESGWNHGGSR